MLLGRNNARLSDHKPACQWFKGAALFRLSGFLSGCLEVEAEIGKVRIPLNLIELVLA